MLLEVVGGRGGVGTDPDPEKGVPLLVAFCGCCCCCCCGGGRILPPALWARRKSRLSVSRAAAISC